MDIGLAIAGAICLLMAVGHTMIGVRWILPGITEENLPKTPFGPHSMSVAMVRVTWFIVTIFVLGIGGLLLSLAWDESVDPKPLCCDGSPRPGSRPRGWLSGTPGAVSDTCGAYRCRCSG